MDVQANLGLHWLQKQSQWPTAGEGLEEWNKCIVGMGISVQYRNVMIIPLTN